MPNLIAAAKTFFRNYWWVYAIVVVLVGISSVFGQMPLDQLWRIAAVLAFVTIVCVIDVANLAKNE